VRYLHADIETVERTEIIRDLASASFDVLVGINLLREGLDMPEVSLVAILDADKEGFCGRTTRSSRRSGARRATSMAGRSCTPTRSPVDGAGAGGNQPRRPPAGRVQPGAWHHSEGNPEVGADIMEGAPRDRAHARWTQAGGKGETPRRRTAAGDSRAPDQELEAEMFKRARNLEFEQAASCATRSIG